MHRAFVGASDLDPANPSLTFPIRAAFYFPWYPEGWDQLGYTPFTRYTPTLGAYYDQADPEVLKQHFEWAKAAGIDAFIAIWRGRDDGVGVSGSTFGASRYNTDTKLAHLLDQALQHGMKVCIYYEIEAYANPTVAEIEYEFDYLAGTSWNHPAYLHVDGLPVVFVYTNGGACELSQRYSDATAGFTTAYLNIDHVTSFAGCSAQPQAWHTWSSDRTNATDISYCILPGFWRIDQGSPVQARNLATWNSNIASMISSGADWQLIISWNEWGEGSQIEPSDELGTAYLDALA